MLISVIVPTYNAEKYITKCISSVVSQKVPLELILVNDGSTDSTASLCAQQARTDTRIKLLSVPNGGPSTARNIGLEEAKGDYIFFLDADDYLEPAALQKLLEQHIESGADLTVCDFYNVNTTRTPSKNGKYFLTDTLLDKRQVDDYLDVYLDAPNNYPLFSYSWGRLFDANIIRRNKFRFNPLLHTYEDVAFNLAYLTKTNLLSFLCEPLYNHLLHDNYLSATMSFSDPKHLFGYIEALKETKKDTKQAYGCYTVIQLIRLCGQIDETNKENIYTLIKHLVAQEETVDSFKTYKRKRGDSYLIPFFIRRKMVRLLMWASKRKARQRYKQ